MAQREGRLHRNFQGYSTHADCDLVALGVSAIGAIGRTYSQNTRTLPDYYRLLDAGVVDLVGIVGYYATLAMIMNVARTPLLEGRPHPIVPLPVQLGQTEGSPTRGRK